MSTRDLRSGHAPSSNLRVRKTTAAPTPPQWSPSSYRTKPRAQPVGYPDETLVTAAQSRLSSLPSLTTAHEIQKLRELLRQVALGQAFLLQGGDCAEIFDYCNAQAIEAKVKLLLQMSLVLIWGTNLPVVRIARMAGQYAKPRSSPLERLPDGSQVPSFRGHVINGIGANEREPDPDRLVQAYFHSAATLNFVRASIASGFADLHSPWDWSLGHVLSLEVREKYQVIVDSIQSSLTFMRTIGAAHDKKLETVDIFTSHEGLLLEYEESLTRLLKNPVSHSPAGAEDRDKPTASWYNTSTHFLWIGDRTRQLDGAHVEYFRGIVNPIGIKVGPTMKPEELGPLLDTVNPQKEIGKVTLITRYGSSKVASLLPAHIRAVKQTDHTVVWQCDPMHGNGISTAAGIKTRRFNDILSELQQTLRIHSEEDSFMGGVHLELTGDDVTECIGGSQGLDEEDLERRYETFCDPRLNEKQALEVAFLVGAYMRKASQKPVEASRSKGS